MSDSIKISEELTLYSGDLITLRAEDGTYLKRYHSLGDKDAVFCYQTTPDGYSYFTVVVVGPNIIRLIAENGCYCKRCYGWEGKSFISMDSPTPDPYSNFVVTAKGDNKITLQAEGLYLKRYYGYNCKSYIAAYMNTEDPYSIFTVERHGVNCKEEVKDFIFDYDRMKKGINSVVIANQTFENNGPCEQEMNFNVSRTVETTKSFEWSVTASIGMDAKFSAGVPLVIGAEGTVNMEFSFTLGGSISNSEQQSFEAGFPITCPADSKIKAVASVSIGRIAVPYTATVVRYLTDGTGTAKYIYKNMEGIYNGNNAFDLNYKIEKIIGK